MASVVSADLNWVFKFSASALFFLGSAGIISFRDATAKPVGVAPTTMSPFLAPNSADEISFETGERGSRIKRVNGLLVKILWPLDFTARFRDAAAFAAA